MAPSIQFFWKQFFFLFSAVSQAIWLIVVVVVVVVVVVSVVVVVVVVPVVAVIVFVVTLTGDRNLDSWILQGWY